MPDQNPPPLLDTTALILAGGRGSRMGGKDKGLVPVAGRPAIEQVLERIRQNYVMGQLDYLRVLESLVSSQGLERSELTARRVLIERRIDLCRSIAGPWHMERPPQVTLSSL